MNLSQFHTNVSEIPNGLGYIPYHYMLTIKDTKVNSKVVKMVKQMRNY